MMTQKQIETLVSSKLLLVKNEILSPLSSSPCMDKNILASSMASSLASIEAEYTSLMNLASLKICTKRFNYFHIKDSKVDDYKERLIQLDQEHFMMAGIRFRGLDKSQPFIEVHPSHYEISDDIISRMAMQLKREFAVFNPFSFKIKLPLHHLKIKSEHSIDRFTVIGCIDQILSHPLPSIKERIELKPLNIDHFYLKYLEEYQLFHQATPYLKHEVQAEDIEDFKESVAHHMGFEIFIDGLCAGVIAALPTPYYGISGAYILEEILYRDFREKRPWSLHSKRVG